MDDPVIVDGLALMRAFFKIPDADDPRKMIELAAALGALRVAAYSAALVRIQRVL